MIPPAITIMDGKRKKERENEYGKIANRKIFEIPKAYVCTLTHSLTLLGIAVSIK